MTNGRTAPAAAPTVAPTEAPTAVPTEASTEAPVERGFTILELTVAMGLLSIFMMYLIQILTTTTGVFTDGMNAQEIAQRSLAATRPIEASLRTMLGPTRESKTQASDARFLVRFAPIGCVTQGAVGELQVLRSTVRVEKHEEKRLLAVAYQQPAAETLGGDPDPEEILRQVQQMILATSFKGRADMLLIAWPEGDPEGAYLELRRGLFLPDKALPFAEAEGLASPDVPAIGGRYFPAKRVVEHTEVLATGLLYLSYRLASQYTRNWIDGPGRSSGGPELVWDSARVGTLAEAEDDTHKFSLDLGDASRDDSTDDVYPRYVEVTVVAARSSQDLPDSMLADDITNTDTTIRLVNTDRLPARILHNFVKIGSEWVRFATMSGRTLKGVRRGQRGTRAKNHPARTGVRVGRTEVLLIHVLHGRDSWNG